jgi:hypothetical protein
MPGPGFPSNDLVARYMDDFWRCFPLGEIILKSEYIVVGHNPIKGIRGRKNTDDFREAMGFADFHFSDKSHPHKVVYSSAGIPLYVGSENKKTLN